MRDAMPALDWDKGGGLLPAIVQDARTQRVLMLGYMSRESLAATHETGLVTFFSRSRQRLWTKGESSGHHLKLVAIETDCDADALLVTAEPQGPTCHLGRDSCFAGARGSALAELDRVVESRAAAMPEGSYTTRLLAGGIRRVAQKVGEEGVETALAAVVEEDAALLGEAADLAYHLLVLLRARGLGLSDLEQVLRTRSA
ncbi:bifunctional phosphoribosyl-AMP cyclohydrolase/phosphoribosyl-ATP diphosphatase HisIE [Luteimonas sp. MC1828]|uniref:bifunctional phosphoribosyl-AMP cyclohydrolase/phosphoribosyl-ATP diphosphatase HisIE n=1 Tax=Luteimonas sp. MC1828 TaxID=2799787 RepID=UPI0018F12A20|nr:bifunctional phosphoribosyl-AMP cyclohydrolase/phosphoribosyl-ATP diphosphatase HisIE [Luteimonas sp. MC1828]MBJ7573771.1 bifunctional phosphoribosyl-AMP cyclohydrolase/phosphoribosyl-ATP diphosphatase HisIE [Luteimonas sp. MC1828]